MQQHGGAGGSGASRWDARQRLDSWSQEAHAGNITTPWPAEPARKPTSKNRGNSKLPTNQLIHTFPCSGWSQYCRNQDILRRTA